MIRILPLLLAVFLLSLSSTEGWSLPPCPEDQSAYYDNCFGTYYHAEGDKYGGEWRDGNMHGQGTYTFADGDKYVGEFRDNVFHGQGALYATDGTVLYEGYWKDDNPVRFDPLNDSDTAYIPLIDLFSVGLKNYVLGTEEASQEDFEAVEIGIDAWDRGDYVAALGELKPLAEAGNMIAEFCTGLVYFLNVNGVPQDTKEALKWFRVAAENDSVGALLVVGLMYRGGEGVEQNSSEAFTWLLRAAERGDAEAQTTVGIMYDNGEGIPENDIRAAEMHQLSAEQGYRVGMANFAGVYALGIGVTKDPVASFMWAQLAQNGGVEGLERLFDYVQSDMSDLQLGRAIRLVRECVNKNYTGCYAPSLKSKDI